MGLAPAHWYGIGLLLLVTADPRGICRGGEASACRIRSQQKVRLSGGLRVSMGL